jgi:ATP-binding cassette subfamily B protein
MAVIFQDFVRFDLTAFENIALGNVTWLENNNPQTVEELVYRASGKVGMHDVIEGLPQGYRTVLSRWLAESGQGVDLSGGEWQKLALARMFMRDADLLILDEPTAALDAQTEYDIYCHFVELVAGKTSLLISHRFSTVRMADKIAILEDSKVSEYGSHEQLLARRGTYAKLYNMQAEMYK